MKYIAIIMLLHTMLTASELKIVADSFRADHTKGISIFEGNVHIVKTDDELNASKVTIYTDANNKPLKFVALGNVSFKIETKTKEEYEGVAGKVVYIPKEKKYSFFENVHLKQLNVKKEIQGDEVVLSTEDGKAYAKGLTKEPVIMIFDIGEEKEK